jgi:hypothetical protein
MERINEIIKEIQEVISLVEPTESNIAQIKRLLILCYAEIILLLDDN